MWTGKTHTLKRAVVPDVKVPVRLEQDAARVSVKRGGYVVVDITSASHSTLVAHPVDRTMMWVPPAKECNNMKPRVGLLIEETDVAWAAAGPGQVVPRLPISTGGMNAEPDLLGRLLSIRRDGGEKENSSLSQPASEANPFDFLGTVDQQPATPEPTPDAFSELAAAKNGTTDDFDALLNERDYNSGKGSGSENAISNPTSPVSGQSQPALLSSPPAATSQPSSNQNDQMDLISF